MGFRANLLLYRNILLLIFVGFKAPMFVVLNRADDCGVWVGITIRRGSWTLRKLKASPLGYRLRWQLLKNLDIYRSDLATGVIAVYFFEMSSSEIEFIQWIVDTRKLWIVPESLGLKEQMQAFERAVSIPRTTPPLALIKS